MKPDTSRQTRPGQWRREELHRGHAGRGCARTVEALATAAFGCAGERCMAGSTAIAVGKAADHVLPSLVEAARAIKVGPTDTEAQPDMGPVITGQHRDRVS